MSTIKRRHIMSGFWFGTIVGAVAMAFVQSFARENGWGQRLFVWFIGWVKSLGEKKS